MTIDITKQVIRILEIVYKKPLNKKYTEDLHKVIIKMVGDENV